MKANKKLAALLAVQMMASALPMVSQAEVTVDTIVNDSDQYTSYASFGMPETTPEQNVFYVGEKPFVLLDADLDDDNSDFYLYSDSSFAYRCFYGGQLYKTDYADQAIVPTWLNTKFLDLAEADGGLPDAFEGYIDAEHTWVTEAGHASGTAPAAYEFTAPIGMLSWTELKEYAPKIGYIGKNSAYLRTGSLSYSNRLLCINSTAAIGHREVGLQGNIHPSFWIDKDFFANNALDVDKMGFNVKRILGKTYTTEELTAAGYTAEDIAVIQATADAAAGIYGTTKPGYAINVVSDNTGTYQWYRCETEADAGTAIEGASDNTYSLVNADGGKYLKVTVTVDGEVAETYTAKIDPALNHGWTGNDTVVLSVPQDVKLINTFELKTDENNQKFILLDQAEDTEAAFFVNTYSAVAVSQIWGTNRWNPNATNGELPAVLATSYYQGTWGADGKMLPQDLAAYIDADHEWLTEAGVPDSGTCQNDFVFKAPVTILSLTEAMQYAGKLSWKVDNGIDYTWLRTPGTLGTNHYLGIVPYGGIRYTGVDAKWSVRPCFWLGEDVFKNIALDLENTGDNVKEMLRTRYTQDELADAGYTTAELINLFDTEVRIDGTLKPGYTVKAKHNNTGTYQWYRSDVEGELGTAIDGATAASYTLVNADGGKYLSFTVTADGSVVETAAAKIDDALVNDWVDDVKIPNWGKNAAAYTFAIESEDAAGQTFNLLDTAEDDASSFFVYTGDVVGSNCFYGTQQFNVNSTDKGILSMILNNGYYQGTWGTNPLPADIAAYIDANHVWLTEGGHPGGAVPNDYIFTAPVSLLSLTEARQYAEKITQISNNYAYLRTGCKVDNSKMLAMKSDANIWTCPIGNVGGVRPCFWLGNDFFKNVRLDILNTGAEVKKMLVERYKRSDLAGIYDDAELTAIGFDAAALSVYDFEYTDADGNVIDEVRYAGGALNISATLAAYAGDATASVVTAVYNEKGDMIKLNLKNFTLSQGVETPVEISVDLSGVEVEKGYTAATYFWNSLEGMVPISNSYEI